MITGLQSFVLHSSRDREHLCKPSWNVLLSLQHGGADLSFIPPPFSPQLCGLLRMIGVLASPTHKDFLCSCEVPRVQRGDEDCRRLFSAQLSGTRSNLRRGKRCPEVPVEWRFWVPGSFCPFQGCFRTGMWLLGQGVQERPNQGNSLLFDFFFMGF